MCGIAGIVHLDRSRPVDPNHLKRMTDSLLHRGPDGEGFFVRENVGLGHRRLAIIDLTTGDQPLYNDDKSLAIILNGEIYNYIELRDELRSLGHSFHTSSDTEVILRAYEEWGLECQQRLNGMWAFSLWDEKRKRLFISRDRLGEKPLYYGTFDGTVLFGSEIKAILAYGVNPEPNLEVTELYLSLGYIPAPYSYYKNVHKLQAGHYLLIENSAVKETQYWDVPDLRNCEMLTDGNKVNRQFEELFHDSVRIRMRSDVPFGAFLSGGLDSATVVASMSSFSNKPVQTFTIGFPNKEFDERDLAQLVSRQFKTNHTEFVVEPRTFDESLSKVLNHFDEPFGDSSAIPTGYVSGAAAKEVKMVLTGDGGDEVLSGYNAYQIEKFADQFQKLPGPVQRSLPMMIRPVSQLFKGNLRYKLNRAERILSYSGMSFESRLAIKSSWCPTSLVKEITKPLGQQVTLDDFISDFLNTYSVGDSFYNLALFHHKVQLPDDFLVKVDRMSMASSLETRVPFLDHRLVEFMLRVSKSVKMNGYSRKSVLKNTMRERLPREIMNGKKRGFSVPLRDWFKEREFDTRLEALYSSDFGLSKSAIKSLVSSHQSGNQDFGYFIWILFVLYRWSIKK